MKNILIGQIMLLGISFQVFAQGSADQTLQKLAVEKGNTGICAGYSVDGKTEWSNAAGYACLDTRQPFSTTTLTRVASISKCFTAVAILQLVEKNAIGLDETIQTYLPDFPKKEKGRITVRQLLAHTSGVSQYENEKEIENTIHYPSLQEAMEVFSGRPLLFEPGTQFFYTTYGYVILGRIIEAVSGLEYEAYMRKNIFEVAGMQHTGVEDINVQYENKSCLYHHGKRKTKEAKQNDLSNRVPGGGFYSTLDDLLKFGNALLDGKLVSDSSLRIMLETQAVQYNGNKYGLGWYLYGPEPHENVVFGHGGTQTGCTSQLMIVAPSKTVVVVLSNTSGNYPDIATFASDLVGRSESGGK